MRIFLAFPFSALLQADDTGAVRIDARSESFLMESVRTLTERGHAVFSAHELEGFGSRLRSAKRCTPLDYLEMRACDAVIAFPSSSGGVHIELGWASALAKPVYVFIEPGQDASPLLAGLDTVGRAKVDVLRDGWLDRPGQLVDEALGWLQSGPDAIPRRKRVAFVSTSFGFGPAAKAAAVAERLRTTCPGVEFTFFGAGVDREFALSSGVFDQVLRIDVDDGTALADVCGHLAAHDLVVSVMNFATVDALRGTDTPIVLIDSLAWLWPKMPTQIDGVARYLAQSSLLSSRNAEAIRRHSNARLVPPLVRNPAARTGSGSGAVINLSGSAVPGGHPDDLADFHSAVLEHLLPAVHARHEHAVVVTNPALAARLAERFASTPVMHLGAREFDARLRECAKLFTVPGLTTTLEASAASVPVAFLPPHNYSQALMAQRYKPLLGDAVIALGDFGEHLEPADGLQEREGVAIVHAACEEIRGRSSDLAAALTRIVNADGKTAAMRLREFHGDRYDGSAVVAAEIAQLLAG